MSKKIITYLLITSLFFTSYKKHGASRTLDKKIKSIISADC